MGILKLYENNVSFKYAVHIKRMKKNN